MADKYDEDKDKVAKSTKQNESNVSNGGVMIDKKRSIKKSEGGQTVGRRVKRLAKAWFWSAE